MSGSGLVQLQSSRSALEYYEAGIAALERATSLIETMHVRKISEALKLQGRLARDGEAIARAFELRTRSERKLGVMLIELKERGLLDKGGRPSKLGKAQNADLVALADVGIDHKLSSSAQKLAGFDLDQFETVVSDGLQKIRAGRATVVNPGKALTTADKKLKRQIREALLAAKQKDLPEDVFQLILADPEWEDEDVWSDAGRDRTPDNHYPTSSVADIAARDIGSIVAKDAILLLWVPMSHLVRGNQLKVMNAWGFEPRSGMVWDKVIAGMGRWVRNRAEVLVIGVRGDVPCPAPGTQWEDIVAVPKSPVHSRKPDFAHEWAEQFFPGLKKIELNARRARPGWAAWGNEAPEHEIPAGSPATDDGRPGDGPEEAAVDSTAIPGDGASGPGPFTVAATPETDGGRLPSAAAPGAGEDAVSHVLPRPDATTSVPA